jgi:hypothetical protein
MAIILTVIAQLEKFIEKELSPNGFALAVGFRLKGRIVSVAGSPMSCRTENDLNYLDFFRSFLSFVLSEKRKTNMIPLMTARHPGTIFPVDE